VRRPSVWEASDEALVAGLATSDRTAAVVFVRRWQRRVYGLALTVVGDERRAEDCAQEAFVRAWRHAGAYDPRRGSVATWLLAIARNVAIDAVRVERARPAAPADVDALGLAMGLAASTPDPGTEAGIGHDVRRVGVALRELPEGQRRAVLLAALHGRTAKEISELEGIPVGTAKTRIRTGLLRLRRQLIDSQHETGHQTEADPPDRAIPIGRGTREIRGRSR
jgi:RNA polymerase sigma factor (sigma-70 family)